MIDEDQQTRGAVLRPVPDDAMTTTNMGRFAGRAAEVSDRDMPD